ADQASGWRYAGIHVDWLTDAGLWSRAVRIDSGFVRNVALFVPAGALITWTSRRPIVTVAAVATLSLLIEITQRTWLLGAPDVSDMIANTAGAAIGTVIALAAILSSKAR
ncbi:MAG TPA: VanZ family protein, partial [Ilumatobacteraceae bacterium]|nr:VanZ family protein [Ilumatobacteraceae bacterium]